MFDEYKTKEERKQIFLIKKRQIKSIQCYIRRIQGVLFTGTQTKHKGVYKVHYQRKRQLCFITSVTDRERACVCICVLNCNCVGRRSAKS